MFCRIVQCAKCHCEVKNAAGKYTYNFDGIFFYSLSYSGNIRRSKHFWNFGPFMLAPCLALMRVFLSWQIKQIFECKIFVFSICFIVFWFCSTIRSTSQFPFLWFSANKIPKRVIHVLKFIFKTIWLKPLFLLK